MLSFTRPLSRYFIVVDGKGKYVLTDNKDILKLQLNANIIKA